MLGLGSVKVDASAAAVWSLVAEPARWQEWSPYVAGAESLGTPAVREGAQGYVILRGGLRIGAEILEVVPGESWTWQVKGLRIRHEVIPLPAAVPSAGGAGERNSGAQGRCRLTMTPSGSGLWAPAAWAYRVPTSLIARNIARVASRGRGPASA
jgi:Polyketide cyclase / dehydrase and lipid transport